ncbi:MAG: hypothetical protein NUV82_00045 [Candidatus Komeilibacteria bacterium]|nr:hypothetical protein [Candidatus Komeilibacteria bacterium]
MSNASTATTTGIRLPDTLKPISNLLLNPNAVPYNKRCRLKKAEQAKIVNSLVDKLCEDDDIKISLEILRVNIERKEEFEEAENDLTMEIRSASMRQKSPIPRLLGQFNHFLRGTFTDLCNSSGCKRRVPLEDFLEKPTRNCCKNCCGD